MSQDVIGLFPHSFSFGLSQYLEQGFREEGFLGKSYLALMQQLYSSAPVPDSGDKKRQFQCQNPHVLVGFAFV